MTTLPAWLIQQIEADEAVARAATEGPWRHLGGQRSHDLVVGATLEHVAAASEVFEARPWVPLDRGDAAHIATHDPARVLAQCAAFRAIVEAHEAERQRKVSYNRVYEAGDLTTANDLRFRLDANVRWRALDDTLRHLASIYADRDGYDETWRAGA